MTEQPTDAVERVVWPPAPGTEEYEQQQKQSSGDEQPAKQPASNQQQAPAQPPQQPAADQSAPSPTAVGAPPAQPSVVQPSQP